MKFKVRSSEIARKSWLAWLALIVIVSMALPAIAQAFAIKDLKGTYSFRLTPVVSFAAYAGTVTAGDPAGLGAAPRQDILRVGVFTADGLGGVSGHTVATTDTNTGATWVVDFTWTGTYIVNLDGTGKLSITTITVAPPPICTDSTTNTVVACLGTEEGAETYAIVVNNQAEEKTVDLTETDNFGGGAKIFMTGQARRH